MQRCLSLTSYRNSVKNEYQQEIIRLVSPDFILVNSKIEAGIDVGTTVIDDYKTSLTYDQAVTVIESNAHKKGYSRPVVAQCFGGLEFHSDRGTLQICETHIKDKNGVTTFQISLNNFSDTPSRITPSFQCVGNCKN